jgi:hypothetical protein
MCTELFDVVSESTGCSMRGNLHVRISERIGVRIPIRFGARMISYPIRIGAYLQFVREIGLGYESAYESAYKSPYNLVHKLNLTLFFWETLFLPSYSDKYYFCLAWAVNGMRI